MSCGEGRATRESCPWWKDGLCGCTDDDKREYAVRNPLSGVIMSVPDNSLPNALKMAALVPKSRVMTRTVTEWVEDSIQPAWADTGC